MTVTEGLPCAECDSLSSCQTARSIWLLDMSFREGGARVERVSLSCPMVPRQGDPGWSETPSRATTEPLPAVNADDALSGHGVGHGEATGRNGVVSHDAMATPDVIIEPTPRRGPTTTGQTAVQLSFDGLNVSHMTVARHLRRMKP
jgi:hypothetical protein